MNTCHWSETVHRLVPYMPGEQPGPGRFVKLNTNENPYPPSPKVLEALARELSGTLRLYPDPDATLFRKSVAEYYGVPASRVFAGNGSDEVLAHTFCALLKHDRPLLFPDVTYSFYPVYCALYGIDFKTVPLTGDFRIRVEDYQDGGGGVIFPNPNAPTGGLLSVDEIDWLASRIPDIPLVVDEAYIDFGGQSAIALVDRHPNILVIQTLSKSRALAGLRVGFAVGSPDLVTALERVRNSFNSYPLDRLANIGGAAAMSDRAYFEETRSRIMQSRGALADGLSALGFEVLPSAANFLFARHSGRPAKEIQDALRSRGIIVRHFDKPRISEFLRITVGTEEECGILLDALGQILPAPTGKEGATLEEERRSGPASP